MPCHQSLDPICIFKQTLRISDEQASILLEAIQCRVFVTGTVTETESPWVKRGSFTRKGDRNNLACGSNPLGSRGRSDRPVTAMNLPPIHAPVLASNRIGSLDVLRGFALLGILVMNMQAYAMIEAAYMNPTAYGDFNGLNRVIWAIMHLLGDLKFMAIFSMLFGAGVILLTERAEAKGRGSAGIHYKRMLWLLVIGLVHAYVFWYGDILVCYAVCGMIIFLLRKLPTKWLFILGAVALIPPSLLFLLAQVTVPFWPPESVTELMADWKPDADLVDKELAAYRGSWLDQMPYRAPASFIMQVAIIPLFFGWRAGGLMLIGMALLKSKVLTAERSTRFYMTMTIAGLGLGLPLIASGIVFNFMNDWSVKTSMFGGILFNYWGSVAVALGYVALVMLAVKVGFLNWLQAGLAAMGRTAFTNYLSQTFICTTLFYGHGFGLFGKVERWQQLALALAILAVQMIISVIWLRFLRYGPMEWLWRSLTYRRIQPMRLPADA